MKEWTEKAIERAENVVYLVVAAILFLIAAAVLVRAVWTFVELFTRDVADVAVTVLDLLLLVFIVVELLFAVRTTLSRRELVAEPFILVGMRVGLGSAWATLVAAELLAAQAGLGYRMQQAQLYYDLATIFVGIVIIGILGLVMDRLLLFAETKLTGWQERR